MQITRELLLAVAPRVSLATVDAWAEGLGAAADAFGVDTPRRVAPWLANISHESRELTALEELMSYRAARLVAVFPRRFVDLADAEDVAARGPEAVAERVYGGRFGNGPEGSGDGWKYRGRGPLGVTFRDNYAACSKAITGETATLLAQPELLADPEFGAASAGWYWARAGCSRFADAGDFDGVCDAINFGRKTVARGDSNGFADRQHYYDLALRALNLEGGVT